MLGGKVVLPEGSGVSMGRGCKAAGAGEWEGGAGEETNQEDSQYVHHTQHVCNNQNALNE